jgi:hypothetical protein
MNVPVKLECFSWAILYSSVMFVNKPIYYQCGEPKVAREGSWPNLKHTLIWTGMSFTLACLVSS